MIRAALLAGLIATLGACEGRKPEISGLGTYKFGTSTREQIKSGVCQPTELSDGRKATWCMELPPIKVGTKTADVDAYFLGTDPPLLPDNPTPQMLAARHKELAKEPLIELQLKVRGCDENELDNWMRQHFGPAAPESKGTHMIWHNDYFWALAVMPSEPARCLIHFLPLSEGSEIERLKATK